MRHGLRAKNASSEKEPQLAESYKERAFTRRKSCEQNSITLRLMIPLLLCKDPYLVEVEVT